MTDPVAPPQSVAMPPERIRDRRDFARSFDSLDGVFAFVQSILAGFGVDKKDDFAVTMTIEELFTNMVKYNAAGAGRIALDVECDGTAVTCRLTDPDSPLWDPTRSPDVDTHMPAEQRRPGGLGLHLIRRFVDSIEYNWADRRSTVTFRKDLSTAGREAVRPAAGDRPEH
jgi:serine/threonine-protein kinase RsbW